MYVQAGMHMDSRTQADGKADSEHVRKVWG